MMRRNEYGYSLNGIRIDFGKFGFFIAHTTKLTWNGCQISIC